MIVMCSNWFKPRWEKPLNFQSKQTYVTTRYHRSFPFCQSALEGPLTAQTQTAAEVLGYILAYIKSALTPDASQCRSDVEPYRFPGEPYQPWVQPPATLASEYGKHELQRLSLLWRLSRKPQKFNFTHGA